METIREAVELLKSLSDDLKRELMKKPFFIVTEADLQGYLYSKLIENERLKEPFMDSKGKPNFRVHLEFPRYRRENDMLKKVGRYDVAVLKKTQSGEFFNDTFDEKEVWLGFEVKAHWNSSEKEIETSLNNDVPAFESIEGKIPSELGVFFYVNIAKRKPCNLERIEQKIRELRKKTETHLFLVYIEAYYENLEPRVLFLD